MKNERILSYKMSQKLTAGEIQDVSAGGTFVATLHATYGSGGGADVSDDMSVDV